MSTNIAPNKMHLKRLDLYQFKNYSEATFDFSPKLNCLTGPNGAGKTNILDAIHYLSMCKSYFNPIDSQNIKHEESESAVKGIFHFKSIEETIQCNIKKGSRKKIKRNGKDYDRLSDHIGLLPVVMIAPADHDLIIGGSEIRRKFMDTIISQTDKNYLENLISYNKVLSHRNALLKKASFNNVSTDQFKIWDDQLIPLGEAIHKYREGFFEEFSTLFKNIYRHISDGRDEVNIRYKSQLEGKSFADLLENAFQKDLALQYCSQGIHKDDIELSIGDKPVKRFGSQGQQKTFVIALKLAQFDFILAATKIKPILLLDDIFDKLDDTRVEYLLDLVAGDKFGQLFVTHTHKDRLLEMFTNIDQELVHHNINYKELVNN